MWVRITGTTLGGTQYAQIAAVSAAGVVTLDRAITAPTGTITWEITYELNPAHIEAILTQVLRNTYAPRVFPLSSHIILNDDNDMESTETITGMFSNTAGTLTKDTTVVYPTGTQSLKVLASATPGYAYLAADIPVTASRQYWASVLESTATGDGATFRIVDVDNSNATIEDATTDEVTWNELSFYFTPPTGCERVNARFISDTNTDITYWDDFALIDTSQRVFPTPSWLIWPEQIIDVFESPQGSAGVHGDNDFRTLERTARSIPWDPHPSSLRATQELMVNVPQFSGNRRYIYAMAPATALSTDVSVSFIDADVIASAVVRILKEPENQERVLDQLRLTTLGMKPKTRKARAMATFG
jgi:hypothetical protein